MQRNTYQYNNTTLFLHNGQQVTLTLTNTVRADSLYPNLQPILVETIAPRTTRQPHPPQYTTGRFTTLSVHIAATRKQASAALYCTYYCTELCGYRNSRKYGGAQRTLRQTLTHPTHHQPREGTLLPDYVHHQGTRPTLSVRGYISTPPK